MGAPSFDKCLLSLYYVLASILGTKRDNKQTNKAKNHKNKIPAPCGAYILLRGLTKDR